jgi:hypothetical protein
VVEGHESALKPKRAQPRERCPLQRVFVGAVRRGTPLDQLAPVRRARSDRRTCWRSAAMCQRDRGKRTDSDCVMTLVGSRTNVHIVRWNAGLGSAAGSLSRQGLYGETGGRFFAVGSPGAFPRNELYGESGRGPKGDSVFAVLFWGKDFTVWLAWLTWSSRFHGRYRVYGV